MRELFMSHASVNNPAIPIPISASGESYPVRNTHTPSESAMMMSPERVRRERIFHDILRTIALSSA